MSQYRSPAIRQLKDRELRNASTESLLDVITRAEDLLHELQPEADYEYNELCRRITAGDGRCARDLKLSGADVLHDLRLLVEDLSDEADLDVAQMTEPVLTVEDVSRRFNVSTKTVERWRSRGLVSRRLRFGNRKRVAFLQSSVDRFATAHAEEVERGSRFSQLTDAEREDVIRQARQLLQSGASLAEVTRQIGKNYSRTPEAIRYTIRKHDQENPDQPLIPNASIPLTNEQRGEIFDAYHRSVPVERLARQYGRSEEAILQIVEEVRAKRLLEEPIEFVYSPEFEEPGAEEVILGPEPEASKKKERVKLPSGLPPYLASLYEMPLLTRQQEVYYFRKMNYLKFCAARLRDELDITSRKAKALDEIERLLKQAAEVRDLLVRSNLRLVVSIAKRHIRSGADFFELISDGNISLMRAIDKFDYTKGFKLSTYATWAVMNNFTRSIGAEHAQNERFKTGTEEFFDSASSTGTDQFEQELVNRHQREALSTILSKLGERDRDILTLRFGLNEGSEPLTLEQVGRQLGVTKERIRQLEIRALDRLRSIAAETELDIPGI